MKADTIDNPISRLSLHDCALFPLQDCECRLSTLVQWPWPDMLLLCDEVMSDGTYIERIWRLEHWRGIKFPRANIFYRKSR